MITVYCYNPLLTIVVLDAVASICHIIIIHCCINILSYFSLSLFFLFLLANRGFVL